MIAPITTRIRGTLGEVRLGPEEGLPRSCVADTASIDLIEKSALVHKLGALNSAKRGEFDAALRFALGLD
jgi:mRNA-degrading endonuclease toxin of MazEF toxin-antitoxin module